MDVLTVPENQEAVVPGVHEEVPFSEEVRTYGRYRGDLDDRGDGEPDLHFHCRWVLERDYHPKEPSFLNGLREMLRDSPERFYIIFQKEKDRFEANLDRQDEIDAKKAAEEKAAQAVETEAVDAGSAKCLELLGKLIGELTGVKK